MLRDITQRIDEFEHLARLHRRKQWRFRGSGFRQKVRWRPHPAGIETEDRHHDRGAAIDVKAVRTQRPAHDGAYLDLLHIPPSVSDLARIKKKSITCKIIRQKTFKEIRFMRALSEQPIVLMAMPLRGIHPSVRDHVVKNQRQRSIDERGNKK